MRKLFNTLFVIIAAMVTFAGCAKEEVNAPANETKTVQFIAESIETKTHFGSPINKSYPTLWDEGDKVKVLRNLAAPTGVSKLEATATIAEISSDLKTASFNVELNNEYTADSYTFYAVVPSTAYNAKSEAEGRFTVLIPSEQTPQENSVDKAAQVLYAKSNTTTTMPSSVQMSFKHFTAYGKLSITGITDKVSTVTSVSLEFADVDIAGKWNYFVADGSVAVKEGGKKIRLTTSELENIWFACAPADVSGKEMTLTVNTDKGPLTKKVTFPANRKFESGKISVFTVSMAGIEPEGESSQYYVKVSEKPSDWSGTYLIVYETGTDAYVFNGVDAANGYVAATISDGKISHTSDLNDSQVTIEPMSDGYAIKTINGYIYGTSGSNKLNFNADSQKLNTIDLGSDGDVLITSNTSVLRFNSASDQMRFRYFKSTSYAGQKAINLYKLINGESGGETPSPEVKVLGSIAVSGEKTKYYTGDEFVKPIVTATYSDATTADVTASAVFSGYDMTVAGICTVSVSYTEGDVTKTAEYYINIEALPTEPIEATVDQVLKADVHDKILYKVTGTISRVANTQYGNFDLKDDTGTIYVYGLRENEDADEQTFGNLELRVGDKVTLIGPRADYKGSAQIQNAYHVSSEKLAAWNAPSISCISNEVTITADEGVTIYYTRNGDEPTTSSIKYNGAFAITESETVKAIAVADGRPQSSMTELYVEYVERVDGEPIGVPITEWEVGSKAYKEEATINGAKVSVLKLGTSSAVGNAKITLPKGTVKVSYSAVAWNGKSCTLQFKVGNATISEQSLKSNTGAANNSPYTMTTTSADNYEFNYSVAADTEVTLQTVSGQTRAIIWNIVAYVAN